MKSELAIQSQQLNANVVFSIFLIFIKENFI